MNTEMNDNKFNQLSEQIIKESDVATTTRYFFKYLKTQSTNSSEYKKQLAPSFLGIFAGYSFKYIRVVRHEKSILVKKILLHEIIYQFTSVHLDFIW
jgi:hypothetical protein